MRLQRAIIGKPERAGQCDVSRRARIRCYLICFLPLFELSVRDAPPPRLAPFSSSDDHNGQSLTLRHPTHASRAPSSTSDARSRRALSLGMPFTVLEVLFCDVLEVVEVAGDVEDRFFEF